MMKTSFQKISFLLVLAAFIAIFGSACKQTPKAAPLSDSVQNYVYAFTSGVISKEAPIRVRFASAVIDQSLIGSPVKNGIIRLNPTVEGDAVWEDDHTLLLKSKNGLKSGTPYVATVQLTDLFDNLPKDAKSFQFDFQTKEQGFNIGVQAVQAANSDNLKIQELEGNLVTYDVANVDDLTKVLTAVQDGKELPIEWSANNERNFDFVVKNIERKAKASEVNLKWNGSLLNISKKGTKTVTIPALGDFKVMNATVRKETGNPYLQLQFSDPLLVNQDLRGLVQIKGNKKAPDFVINGNILNVYPKGRISGTQRIEVNPGILNSEKAKMQKSSVWDVFFEEIQPQVRTVRQGVIMPNSDGLVFPFEAVSLNAVEVEVFKIFHNNILQFLQTNSLNGQDDLQRVGRVILQKKIPLENLNPEANSFSWSRYALDLNQLFEADPSAIYQIRIGFRPSYSSFTCANAMNNEEDNVRVIQAANRSDSPQEDIKSFWGDYYGIDGWYDGFRWSHREDPCQPGYYNYERFIASNVLSSNIGIIAKGGKNKDYFVAVTDLVSAKPLGNVQLEFYDYQQQLLRTATTDGAGIAEVTLDRKPFAVIAAGNGQKGYLKLADGHSLSLSRYDVSGTVAQKGMKGFIYGERGVWRPGDSLFLNFILEDKTTATPTNHPITFELYDSRGQLQKKETIMGRVDNNYSLYAATSSDAPTGNWMAKVKAGGATFSKVIKVETIKPNRLKIKLDFGKESLQANDFPIKGNLQVNWLHGAPAKNLDAKIEMQVVGAKTSFDNFNNFEFDDPARNIDSYQNTIFEGSVDNTGKATFDINQLVNNNNAPGKLLAKLKTRAFEKGGDFSSNNTTIPFSPYPSYAGIRLPKNKYGSKRIELNKEGTINMILLDENGNPLKNKTLDVGLYRLNWRWWWDRSRDNLSSFNRSNHYNAEQTIQVTTNAKGEAKWSITPSNWGRYLVRVCDNEGGHCTGDFFYAGYPWYGEQGQVNRQEAAMMTFSADKQKYAVGDEIQLNVPASDNSRVLITLENGTKVLDSFWGEAKKGDNTFSFSATQMMAPTIYAHVALIQPHGQVDNDLPIRMYGVIPLTVENPKTILHPQLKMPDELAPEQTVTLEISEKNNQPMAYTIAMVDDGLLDLTNFKTPNPHSAFYAREALGVKTWDIYDHVLGAYGEKLERILSIGGDGVASAKPGSKSANRFKPVVRHLGPFYLNAGKKVKHQIKLPNYVGSVRTMVVASNSQAAYGHTEKTTAVKKPLMILATLPRVLGPTETLQLPVSVFAMDKKVKNVSIDVSESTGLVKFMGGNQKQLKFSQPGEEMVYFDVQIGEQVGIAKFKITAKGGGETAIQNIEIDVRNPNPYVTNVLEKVVQPGESWTPTFDPVGLFGTNEGILEVTNLPPINLGKRLKYLIRYPHGCIEQTTSSGFPQVFVNNLLELNESQKMEIPKNIQATLNRLTKFQTAEGGFSYWPGQSDPSSWGTNYGGHFMLEAKEKGYTLPPNMLNRWVAFQKKRARQWKYQEGGFNDHGIFNHEDLMQSYRLYTLAKAGEAELGAMNRMREIKSLSSQAKWRLAAAYAQLGKISTAKDIINNLNTTVASYRELSGSYGSDTRDEAMILETLVLLGETEKAALMVKTISGKLSAKQWMCTQTTAYALMGIAKFAKNQTFDQALTFDIQLGRKSTKNAGAKTPVMQIDVPVDEMQQKSLSLKNTSGGILYTRLILSGQPLIGDQTASAENLNINVQYKTTNGAIIDPSNLEQGTDFVAEIQVTNPGSKGINYEEMALTQIFPSGWEIINSRMDGFTDNSGSNRPEYQDIRDDRVYSYFDIRKNQTHIYRVQLNAAYTGKFYLPTVSCEAMYDNSIQSRVPGQWVEVVKGNNI